MKAKTTMGATWARRALAALALWPLLWGGAGAARAAETEHNDFKLFRAPGKVVVDGKFDDWDLSGSMFVCSDVENFRNEFASWQSAMYDDECLYLLSRWVDSTPMNNPGLCGSDQGFAGDCLQMRIIVNANGQAVKDGDGDTQRTTHVTAWRGRDGRDVVNLEYGRNFNEGGVPDAKKEGARQAFLKNADGKGYVQEIAIPWKLLTKQAYKPKAGDVIIMTYEPNFGTTAKLRISTKDLFRAGIAPDRVFAFMASNCWAPVKLLEKSDGKPMDVRLADKRTFSVAMEDGLPVVSWDGLYQENKLEGFKKIAVAMPEDGFVSIIVKNAAGQVVRNLVNGDFMAKGNHEIMWDGLTTPSDLRPGEPVPEGEYSWEAVRHRGLNLNLVGWAANAGSSPFDTPGGNWGGDHGVPSGVDSDGERVILGWTMAEAGAAVVCCDPNGKVLWRHSRGGFGTAGIIAADAGFAFVYDSFQGNVIYRLNAERGEYANWEGSEESLLDVAATFAPFAPAGAAKDNKGKLKAGASGIAAAGGRLFIAYGPKHGVTGDAQPSGNKLIAVDAKTGKVVGSADVKEPGDVKRGADGKLYLLCADGVVTVDPATLKLGAPIVKPAGAVSVAADKDGNVYVGVNDPANQVLVFAPDGKELRRVGKQGGRALVGPWEKDGMRFIAGMKVGGKGQLWVMEKDDNPRRISRWNAADGAFSAEFFGPTAYGALGGAICPADPLTMIGQGCEWKINPDTGKADCVAVIFRKDAQGHGRWHNARFGSGPDGRVYAAVGGGWSGYHPVYVFERLAPGQWKLRTKLSALPKDGKIGGGGEVGEGNFDGFRVWADRNDDQREQPEEVHEYRRAQVDTGAWIDGWYMCMNQSLTFSGGRRRIAVTGWTPCGAPEYDLTKAKVLPGKPDGRGGMGAQWDLVSEDGRFVLYNGFYAQAHSDLPCYDVESGKLVFSYPSNYTGVHGGHSAPPARQGLIRAAYDIVGTVKMPQPVGNVFFIATDKGEWHLLNDRGHYLGHIFQGDPMRIRWPESIVPGALLNDVPPGLGAEDFGGSLTRANDGKVYIQHGKTAFINSRLSGLETLKELPGGKVTITKPDTVQAQAYREKMLHAGDSDKAMAAKKKTVNFTGDPAADFGNPGVAFENGEAKITSWLAYDADNLYLGWKVADKTPWVNGATAFENMYACGDTVDFQLGTDPAADKRRGAPVKGDFRLSIGRLGGKDTAAVYWAVADAKAPKTFYSGVWRDGYTMDCVRVVPSAQIKVTEEKGAGYVVEAKVPLKEIGLAAKAGLQLRGDFGATFGDASGKDTTLRVHWSNKATGIVADEVEELKMQPSKWGAINFEE